MDVNNNGGIKKTDSIPVWRKYGLNISEACEYFGLGRNSMYELCKNNPDADWLLKIGSRIIIKRELFEKYFDALESTEI